MLEGGDTHAPKRAGQNKFVEVQDYCFGVKIMKRDNYKFQVLASYLSRYQIKQKCYNEILKFCLSFRKI